MNWETENAVVANVSLENAWAYYSDIDNWSRHEGDAVESITLDGPFQSGTRGVTRMAGQNETHWLLAKVEPHRRTIIETKIQDAVLRVIWIFEALKEDQTRLTQRMILEGPGTASYIGFMEEHFAKNMGPGMERMARSMEQYFQ